MDYINHRVGALSEITAMKWFANKNYEVYVPVSGSTICDFVAISGTEVIRVQVKTVNMSGRVPCISTARNKNSMKRQGKAPISLSKEDCDLVVAVLEDSLWCIPADEVKGRQTICLTKLKKL